MTFYVENETDEKFDFDVNLLVKDLVEELIKLENIPFKDITLNLTFTDDENIQEINKEFRDIDKSTDVLSFPAIDFETPSDFSFLTGDEADYFDPDTKELILGDIMISIEHAHAQAVEYGHSYKREIAFLITHSLLHLCGYDHMEDSERIVMEEKQESILSNLRITRD